MASKLETKSHDADMKPVGLGSAARSHAYDPATQPEYFYGILSRRMMAFLVDVVMVMFLLFAAASLVFILGIFTFGLAWLLFPVLFSTVALAYSAWTMSRPSTATVGMRMFDLEIRTWYGAPMTRLLGAFHTLLFYFSITFLAPFILLLSLFDERKRCLHDMLMGTVVVNTPARAKAERG